MRIRWPFSGPAKNKLQKKSYNVDAQSDGANTYRNRGTYNGQQKSEKLKIDDGAVQPILHC